jgi:soluble lytic murein transglycosylase-like protein
MDPITILLALGALGFLGAAVKKHVLPAATDVPPAFLASLSLHESGNNPNVVNPTSHATGLFQITSTALTDYNRRHDTQIKLDDMRNPALATSVAADHIKQILALYKKRPSLKPNWRDRRVVELIVLGWNAGHGGVHNLARDLEAQGATPPQVTVNSVSQLAAQRNIPYISDAGRVGWARQVAATYLDRRVA